jgi:hypothetical protein
LAGRAIVGSAVQGAINEVGAASRGDKEKLPNTKLVSRAVGVRWHISNKTVLGELAASENRGSVIFDDFACIHNRPKLRVFAAIAELFQ